MTNLELVKKGLDVYNHKDHWTYCHGAIGYIVGTDKVKSLYEYFLSIGKNTTGVPYSKWLADNVGKFCCDCSNFINYLMGFTVSAWSTTSFTKMEEIKKPIAGCICWKEGHVGLAISDTEFIHFPYYGRTCERAKISDYNWAKFYKLPPNYVTYVEEPKTIYRVQVGAYYNKALAENLMVELKKKGYDGFIVESK